MRETGAAHWPVLPLLMNVSHRKSRIVGIPLGLEFHLSAKGTWQVPLDDAGQRFDHRIVPAPIQLSITAD